MEPVTEAELIEKAVRPRITEDQLKASIVEETYTLLPNGRTTICQLTLTNGFTVEGKSACVAKENYNEELGNRIAKENAFNELWQLYGFDLATKLKLVEAGIPPSRSSSKTYVGTKIVHAELCTKRAYCKVRKWDVPADEDPNEMGYIIEYADGQRPNVEGYEGYVSWSPKDVFEKSYSLFS